jgi:hypothetical protein
MAQIDKDLIQPRDEPDSERLHRLARAGLSAVPILGGAITEIFNSLIEPPLTRRRTEWMIQVSDAINDLYKKGIVTEQDLQHNETFLTTLFHASAIAIKNHQSAKREALRNAVINSALPGAPDDTVQQIFVNLIDSCTSWHIALLQLFQGPEKWAAQKDHKFPDLYMGALSDIVTSAFPALAGQEHIYQIIWQELFRTNFVSSESLSGTMSGSGLLAKRTTDFGDQFLKLYLSRNFQHQPRPDGGIRPAARLSDG